MTRLESQAAAHRFDVMLSRDRQVALGRKRPPPSAAWRGIAVRLNVVAQLVPSAYVATYRDRAREAWARWSASHPPVVAVSYVNGRVVAVQFAREAA